MNETIVKQQRLLYETLYQSSMIREPGNPKRKDIPLRSIEDVIQFVNKCNGDVPAFMSIYSYTENYHVRYEKDNKGEKRRIAEYSPIIFDGIRLDFDIQKEDKLLKEGLNSEDLRIKGEELIHEYNKEASKEKQKTPTKSNCIRTGEEYYLKLIKEEDAKQIQEINKKYKSKKDRNTAIMDYYYNKYTSNEYLLTPYKEAIKTSKYIQDMFDVTPIMFFSGGHGIHLYILCNPIEISNPNDVVKWFGLKLIELLGLTSIDKTVVQGVNKHLLRIPLSRHQETKLYVVPFDLNTSYFEVLDYAREPAINVEIPTNQDTTKFEDFIKYASTKVEETKKEPSKRDIEYKYSLTGSLMDLQEPFSRIYTEGQRNYTAHPLIHFLKGANIPQEEVEQFFDTLPVGTGLDRNVQSWIDTAYNTNKPYQDTMGYFINTVKTYSHSEEDKNHIIKKFNEYFNSNNGIPGETTLAPGLVQFQENVNYKDGLYTKYLDKEKGGYNYSFLGNILIHELHTTYDVLGEFNPVVTLKYTNTAINKTLQIEDKSFGEISQRIYKAQLIDTNSQGIESKLRKISIHSVNKELPGVKVTANEDLFKEGFFYNEETNSIIHNNEFNNLTSSKEDVQEAIRLTNKIISNRGTAIPNDCTVLRFTLWSPYAYAMKQLGFNKSLYGLCLWGVRDTNKTGSCENWSYFYVNPDVINQDADTPSAFGTRLGENTYPLLIDEAYNLLSNKDNEETLKKAVTNKTARAVKNKYDNEKIDPSPALRMPIYTLNPQVPVIKKEEFIKRYKVLHYDNSMKLSKTKIKEFIKEYKPQSPNSPLHQLKHLGKVFANKFETYLNERSDKLHDVEALTVEILKEIAKDYEEPFTPAIYDIQEIEADAEDIGFNIQQKLTRLFYKNHKTLHGYDGVALGDFTFASKYGEIAWLDYQPTTQRFVIHVKEFEKEVNDLMREYIPIEEIFDRLNIELDPEINPKGFNTYSKFKGKSIKAVKISEFDLTFKLFNIDIYEEGKAEEKLKHEEEMKKKRKEVNNQD